MNKNTNYNAQKQYLQDEEDPDDGLSVKHVAHARLDTIQDFLW